MTSSSSLGLRTTIVPSIAAVFAHFRAVSGIAGIARSGIAVLLSLAAFMPAPPAAADPALPASAIEFYHPFLDHYFVTANPAEISALSSGRFFGWTPTGFSFPVLSPDTLTPGSTPVCRFYGNSDVGLDSHFYSASPAECDDVLRRFPDTWLLESRSVFRVYAADPSSGSCPTGTTAVRRLWNKRADTNHRYTDRDDVAADMELRGYELEGYGVPTPTAFCVPIAARGLSCEVVASNPMPGVGTTVTLTATCSENPTTINWIGCTGQGNSCTATSTTPGGRAYVLSASTATSVAAPVVATVVWQPAGTNPNSGPVTCSIYASSTNPFVNTTVGLTANCTGNPTTFRWTGCTSSTQSCNVQSSTSGSVTYSVTASNGGSTSAPSSIVLNWKPLGAAVVCSVVTSNAIPAINTDVTLTASCTGNPTSYTWSGCSSTSSTCVATSASAGTQTYTVSSSGPNGYSAPASVAVNWQSTSLRPACTLAASSSSPAVNTNIVLTASCTGNPTSFTWTGCSSAGATCTASSSTAGARTYSIVARNATAASAPASVNVNWSSLAPPPPVTPGLSYTTLPSDPATYAAGWTRMLYSPNLGKFVIFGGDSHNPAGNNSVRYFDARARSWEIALPNTNGASGLLNRDNGAVFVNSRRGELIALEGAVKGNGVFDLQTKRWTALDAASGRVNFTNQYVKDFDRYVYYEDPAHTYSNVEDTFALFGGNMRPSVHLFVPNPSGPQPYKQLQYVVQWGNYFPMGDNIRNPEKPNAGMQELWSPSAPNGVDQMENSGVAIASSLYWMQNFQMGVSLCGTTLDTVDASGQWAGSYRHSSDEMWRLDIPATVRNFPRPAFEFLGRNPLPDAVKIIGGKWVSAYDPTRQLYVMVKGRQVNIYSIPRKLWWGGIVSDTGIGDNAVGDVDPVADLLVIRWHDGAPSNNQVKGLDLRKLDALIAQPGMAPVMQRHLVAFGEDSRIRPQPTCTPDRYFYSTTGAPPVPAAPSCTVAAGNATPITGSAVTLTAACTGSPTSYRWTGCTSSTSTCTATSATAGAVSYSVTATNAAGTSAPAGLTLSWQLPAAVPSCTLSASNPTPSVGTSVSLTASCTGNPTSYAWTGCTSAASTCSATSAVAGTVSYSVRATNASGTSLAAQATVTWQGTTPPPPPVGTGNLAVTMTPLPYSGPSWVLGSSKHLDFARLGDRWYKMTGDHAKLDANSPASQGGRQEILSFNALRNDWRQDQPFYIPDPTQVQLALPDDAFTIVRGDEAWVFVSERVISTANIAQPAGVAQQIGDDIMAWKPGRGWRRIMPRPSEIRGNRAWRGIYDPVRDRFVIPVARNGLVWVLIGGDGTDQTQRTSSGTPYVFGDHDFHASGLAADVTNRVAYAYDHVRSELWSVNLDTLAIRKLLNLPEPAQGNSPTTKVAWHPGLRAVVIAATKLHAYQVDSGRLTTWNRPDGFINSNGTQVTSSTIFYDPDTQDVLSVGSIDWETGRSSAVYWRLHIQ